jgi:hypothetical protein
MERADLEVELLEVDERKAAYLSAHHDVSVEAVHEVWLNEPLTSSSGHRPVLLLS